MMKSLLDSITAPTDDRIRALTDNRIRAFTADRIGALTDDRIRALTDDRVRADRRSDSRADRRSGSRADRRSDSRADRRSGSRADRRSDSRRPTIGFGHLSAYAAYRRNRFDARRICCVRPPLVISCRVVTIPFAGPVSKRLVNGGRVVIEYRVDDAGLARGETGGEGLRELACRRHADTDAAERLGCAHEIKSG